MSQDSLDSKRSSRVIHTRLEDYITLGCFNILRSKGVDISGMPMSSAVGAVLDGIISNMMEQGAIPYVLGVAATHQLNQLVGVRDIQELDLSNVDFSKYVQTDEEFSIEETPEKREIFDTIGAIAHEMKERAKTETEEQLFSPAAELQAEWVETEPTLKPWEREGILSWEEIQETAPKDVYVDEAAKMNSELMKRAIQIAYSQTKITEWGTAEASRKISAVVHTIKKYFI